MASAWGLNLYSGSTRPMNGLLHNQPLTAWSFLALHNLICCTLACHFAAAYSSSPYSGVWLLIGLCFCDWHLNLRMGIVFYLEDICKYERAKTLTVQSNNQSNNNNFIFYFYFFIKYLHFILFPLFQYSIFIFILILI